MGSCWGGCAVARLLREGPAFRLRPEVSGAVSPGKTQGKKAAAYGNSSCKGPQVGDTDGPGDAGISGCYEVFGFYSKCTRSEFYFRAEDILQDCFFQGPRPEKRS
jgi:hypothetical protein